MISDNTNNDVNIDALAAAPAGKRMYTMPFLKKFGSVQSLTGSTPGSGTDGGASAGMTATAAEMMMSDSRCKTNIVRIGTHPDGFGLYLFNYLPPFHSSYGSARQFGVLAQEIETIRPEAVSIGADGLRRVDYRLLGVKPTLH